MIIALVDLDNGEVQSLEYRVLRSCLVADEIWLPAEPRFRFSVSLISDRVRCEKDITILKLSENTGNFGLGRVELSVKLIGYINNTVLEMQRYNLWSTVFYDLVK
ncbi:hypothetical protein J6590_089756 [Homalodisca vitripennis]|nr:hypothetical protein J6590_089756 [Homalodisca vitripennis]